MAPLPFLEQRICLSSLFLLSSVSTSLQPARPLKNGRRASSAVWSTITVRSCASKDCGIKAATDPRVQGVFIGLAQAPSGCSPFHLKPSPPS